MFFIIFSFLIFYYFYYKNNTLFVNSKESGFLRNFFYFFNKRFYLDSIFNLFLSFFLYKSSYKIFFMLDKGIVEILGPKGSAFLLHRISLEILKSFHSGKISTYLFLIFFVLLFQISFLC